MIEAPSGHQPRDERLQKILSRWGVASRRQAEVMIQEGRIRINGEVVHQLGQKANPDRDAIEIDGSLLSPHHRPQRFYLLLNKPLGVICTCADPQNRTTVLDLLPPTLSQNTGIHPVGRLDGDSTGALLLTNDGDFTFQMTHPSHSIPKTYRVWVEGIPSESVLEDWRNGIVYENIQTLPAKVRRIRSQGTHKTLLEIILWEGRNRQIRKVAQTLGHPVVSLHRSAIGSIRLKSLPRGEYRDLRAFEIAALRGNCGTKQIGGEGA
ncbi:pseudouridine synthase [Roseofilum sp. BLCC_M154]|uniref:Pseudouridine synthase n=1 Tax=Roseofilum acuticapitatum BLCC-M154 TaxID=3022444 RepID=A0ABT7AVU1_9CYAN|nr:pseudouridine synthase [Roseofilum acuticapitatum BLCC-M154]